MIRDTQNPRDRFSFGRIQARQARLVPSTRFRFGSSLTSARYVLVRPLKGNYVRKPKNWD